MAQKFTVPITVKQLSSPGSDAITVFVDADSYSRLKVEAGGRLTWGDGTVVGDTNLYRDSANVLKTDDTFKTPILYVDDIEIDTTGATTNQVLKFNGTKFIPGTASTVGSIDDLSDVTITSASVGQVLKWNGTAWINDSDASGSAVGELDDLSDAVITAPEEFQTLEYNGTNWVNSYSSTVTYVRNVEATTLTTGTVVYLFGATGDHAAVKRADKASDVTSSKTVGVIGANIAASQNGPVVTRGYVDGINLSVGYSPGDVLWLGSNGQFTTTKAVAPDHLVFVGVVVRATNNGIIYVATQNGFELDELHNVNATSPNSGDFLKYNGSLWVNDAIDLGTDTTGSYVQNLVAGTGVTLTNNSGESATPTIAIGQDVATNSNVTFNNLTVAGNLTVSGTTTSISTETVTIDDNIIVLNNNATGAPSVDAGIEIERGSSTNVLIRWNETTDKWQFTNDGSTYSDLGAGGASVSSSAPASPTSGALWFNQDTAQTFVYYGSVWIEVGAVSNGARVEVSASAPASPVTGDLWFDSDTAQTFAYYDSQWVEIGASGMAASIGDTAPTSPVSGQIWFDSTNASTNVYYDSHWVEVGGTTEVFNFIDAKGDLIVGTADNTVDNLAVGTNGQVLTADSTTATGLKWSTPTVYQEVVANVSNTEIGYLDGVTSAIQTQIDTKASTGKAIAMAIVFG